MIGLWDIDSKLPNLASMKRSNYYKSLGEQVGLVDINNLGIYRKIYASCLFTWNRDKCLKFKEQLGDRIEFGGTGWDFKEINGELKEITHTVLPLEIENMKPDYELYTPEIIYERIRGGIGKKDSKMQKAKAITEMGMDFSSRGCVRKCSFCLVHKKEGCFKQAKEIRDIINPKSNFITLLDNNLTADPYCIEKLNEIRDRKLIVNISQGIDVRLITEEKAKALSEVKHQRSIHYAWDLPEPESQVLQGIDILSQYIKPYRHMCYVLVGFNTSFEEDMYRVLKLKDLKIDPYVMIYNKNQRKDERLKHFARWVNGRIYKVSEWKDYEPWVKAQNKIEGAKKCG